MDQLEIELIKRKAVAGVITFTARTFLIQIFSQVAIFILTVLLEPSVFGIFFLVSAIINFFVYFSDIGLAAALIQKKEGPSKADLATTFTIQQSIILIFVTLGLIFSFEIAKFYNLDADGLTLLRILIISLLFSSLKTIPSILLERKLDFTKLVIPQIAENVVFYSTALILAIAGFHIAAFTWAVLARGIVGLILIYIISPWRPSISFNRESAKNLTSFGLPFQANSILALLKDDLLTVFLGKVLTLTQVGYIGWAQKWAYVPLRFFMDNVNKVTFPAYSRLQDQSEQLGKAIEKSIFFVTLLTYPSLLGIMAITPSVVQVIPNYQKWQPAVPLLYLFAVNGIFSSVSTTFTNTLFALGKPRIVLNFMVFWTCATWLLTLPLISRYGFLGVGIASAIVASTSVATIYVANKSVKVNVLRSILGPLASSVFMFLCVKVVLIVLPPGLNAIIIGSFSGAIIYFTITYIMFKKRLKEGLVLALGSIRPKKL